MIFPILSFLIVQGLVLCIDDKIGRQEFIRFKSLYNKKYRNLIEENLRYQLFSLQLDRVVRINTDFNNKRSTYKLAINQYSDLAYNEFLSKRCGLIVPSSMARSAPIAETRKKKLNVGRQIASFDWRDTGHVGLVKDQFDCGGCWAFAATAAIETQWSMYYGKLKNLSEQNLIDCTVGNYGCNGGVMQLAYDYVRKNKGINDDLKYPYVGAGSASCRYKAGFPAANVSGYVQIEKGNEQQLEMAVREYGPVSVGVHASPDFMMYNGGVFNGSDCTNTLNHAVVVVGFNNVHQPNFWIVRNSWGSWWGESGYIRMLKGSNICGIANLATYPIIV
ncbi:Cathepsin L [Brachionus plicatilis]|uniref:Cathepsin L n=1 Tax=Brachionus plicatilis TaxID=10195 RepID=A0A3M7RWA1_BRAPC|nr:Cathepsin L [Brachionus plicatilis]